MTKRFLFCLFTSIFCISVSAQTASSPRPKIALVLEGGGALGLAHIGVLDWLEQNHIPIDYVAGTSMGGLVGGFYASGRSPAEIRKLVAGLDWNGILSDKLPYQDLSFRRKEDQRAFPNDLEFGIRDGIRFPSGFSPGHEISQLLDREMYPYSQLSSFDDLPIPFRCVGVDIVSRTEKVFKEGSLAQALRSTMSIPAVFSPVRTEDAIYVDGGLLNNLPTDVARQMGADMVIAVHLRTKPISATQSLSSFGVLAQSMSVVVSANELRSMENADILITVDLSGYSSSDYKLSDKLMQEGFNAAAQKFALFSKMAVGEQEWNALLEARRERKPNLPLVPTFVRAHADQPAAARQIEKQLAHFKGKELDFGDLEKELDHIVGSGRFSQVGYEVVREQGAVGLSINTVRKDYAPPMINPLIEVDGSEYRNTSFMVGGRITFLDIGIPGSEWRNDVILGSEYSVKSEYYRPLTPFGKWFIAPSISVGSRPYDIYNEGDLLAQYREQSASGGIDLGYALNRNTEIRAGYSGGYSRLYRVIGDSSLPDGSGRTGTTSLKFSFNGMDSPVVPHKGFLNTSVFQWHDAVVNADEPFPSLEIRTIYVKPVSTAVALYLDASGGSSLGFANSGVPLFSLGGVGRLSAYGRNELLANQYWLGRAGYLQKLTTLPPLLGGGLFLTGSYEIGKAYGIQGGPNLPMDGTVGIVIETAFGPLFTGASVGDSGHHRFLFRLGRFF